MNNNNDRINLQDPGIAATNNNLNINPNTTVDQDAYALHASRIRHLRELIDQKGADYKDLQEKIQFVQKLIRSLNDVIDEKNGINLNEKDHAELLKLLKTAEELELNTLGGKTTLTRSECDRLLENLNSHIGDWDLDCKSHLHKLEKIVKEYDQSTVLLKNLLTTLKKTKDLIISNIKH